MRRRTVLIPAASAVLLVVAFGLYWFQPWRLWTHSHIDESLPGYTPASLTASGAPAPVAAATAEPPSPAPAPAPTAVVLAGGGFRSGEHRTSGTALLIRLPDGQLVIRLENFSTSDGPDVHVILSPNSAGSDQVGDYLHLGGLKATSGNENYLVPAGTDVSGLRSVVIWCQRFDAVFGSADLVAQ